MNVTRTEGIVTLATYLLLSPLVGCATTSPPAETSAVKKLETAFLKSLEHGKTTKQTVILKLGQPSGSYEGERILTWRLGTDEEGFFVRDQQTVARYPTWTLTKYSLVLIFDENNVLTMHSLVPVR